jgi:hypothetical protein
MTGKRQIVKGKREGRWRIEDRRWRMEDGRWRMEDRGLRIRLLLISYFLFPTPLPTD